MIFNSNTPMLTISPPPAPQSVPQLRERARRGPRLQRAEHHGRVQQVSHLQRPPRLQVVRIIKSIFTPGYNEIFTIFRKALLALTHKNLSTIKTLS